MFFFLYEANLIANDCSLFYQNWKLDNLFLIKISRNLRTTSGINHGAIHKASEQLLRNDDYKPAADAVQDLVQFPWLGSAVRSITKKLKKLFPTKTPETQVVWAAFPKKKKMPDEKALSFMLWRNITVDAYRQILHDSQDEDGFSVGFSKIVFKILKCYI